MPEVSHSCRDLGRRVGRVRRGGEETPGGDQEQHSANWSVALGERAMTLAIVAYPGLREADRQWIESFRAKHDPQSARLAVQFTLVFPVEATPRVLKAELEAAAASCRPISFAIRRTEAVRDAGGSGARVFLVPDEGRAEIAALHDRLYAGALSVHLRADIPFVPHITIGAAPDQPSGERLAEAFSFGARVVRGTIATLDVVDVGGLLVRTVMSHRFGIA